MNCEDVEEVTGFYAIGALPARDMAAVAEHLESCRDHDLTLARLGEAATALPYAVEEREAPAALRSRIMAAVRADGAPAPEVVEVDRPRKRWSWMPLAPRLAFGALLVVIAGLLAWNIQIQRSQTAFSRSLVGEQGAVGQLFYVDKPEFGILSTEGLPAPGPGETYQVWCTTDQGLESRGTVAIVQQGQGLALINGDMPRSKPVFLTLEPAGGSAQPTGRTVLTTNRSATTP